MNTESKECCVCHATSTDRVITDGSRIFAPMCFDCLWSETEMARRGVFQWTGIPIGEDAGVLSPDATETEIRLACERFDACREMLDFLVLLHSALIARGRDSFSYEWMGGRVDEPTTMSDEKLLRLRAFMATKGYDEVACQTLRDDNPRIGAYHQMQGEESPHWHTRVEFLKRP
jgi:hypothetical protein